MVNFKRMFFYSIILVVFLPLTIQAAEKKWVYTVVEGDSLWSISQEYLEETAFYQKLQKLNGITYPKKLQPNTLIEVPMSWIKSYPTYATITAISGKSTFFKQGETQVTKLGSILSFGDILTVDANSSVSLTLVDGSVLTLLEKSKLSFESLISYGKTGMADTQLKLHQGKVETQAKKSKGPGSRLDISTASAISSVRGTVYRVAHSPQDHHSLIEVLEGEVEVNAQMQSEYIAKGFASKVAKGQVPSKPIMLLNAPRFISTKKRFEGEEVNFDWENVKDALAYKVQISSNNTFTDIIWQQHQPQTVATLAKIVDGDYFVRVSALSLSNIEGFARSTSFSVNNKPLPPFISEVDTFFDADTRELTWAYAKELSGSLLQIASDSNFANVIILTNLSESSFIIPNTLPFGKYYWRVAGVDHKGRGPFSKGNNFLWQAILSPVQWNYQHKTDQLVVDWSALKVDESVQIQVADESDFMTNTQVFESVVKTLSIPVPNDRDIYIRSRVINKKLNVHGEWSDVKTISNNDDNALISFAFLALFILL
jgi:hypothetical protein